jgi:predicted naringenin-chalcone synthase
MLIQAWRQANDRSDSFVDHSGTVRDARTGKAIEVILRDDGQDNDDTLGETVEYPRGWRILIVGLSQSLDLGSMMLGLTCSKLNVLGNMLSVCHVVVDFRPINVY